MNGLFTILRFMKRLFTCMTLLLLLNTNGIIGQDTVRIPLKTSVKIIQDLGRFDEARVKIVLLEENVRNYKLLIDSYEKSNLQNKEIIQNISMIKDFCKTDLAAMQKKYKSAVRLGRFYLVIAGLAVGFGIFQAFK